LNAQAQAESVDPDLVAEDAARICADRFSRYVDVTTEEARQCWSARAVGEQAWTNRHLSR